MEEYPEYMEDIALMERKPRSGGLVAPHNAEAERSVLGGILRFAERAADQVVNDMEPEDFYVPAHQIIFRAIQNLYHKTQPIDHVTVTDSLQRSQELEKVGGVIFLTELLDAVPSAANIEYYAGVVADHATRRSMIKASAEINELALALDQDIDTMLDSAEREVLQVAERRMGDGLEAVGDQFNPIIKKLEELENLGSDIVGLSTGLTDLDKKLAGLQKSNLVVVAGRPSMGKSALATTIATHVAINHGPVAIFSLEMSRQEVAQRILCSYGGINSVQVKTGKIGNKWGELVQTSAKLHNIPLYVDEAGGVSVMEIRAKCRRLQRTKGLELVVVDYLQLMEGRRRSENRQTEIAEISRALKGLATELSIPVLAVSQLNRALEARHDKRPQLGDLRESGAIEQDADVVILIYRDEEYNDQSPEAGTAQLNVAKHRSGPTGVVRAAFHKEFTRFADLAYGSMPDEG